SIFLYSPNDTYPKLYTLSLHDALPISMKGHLREPYEQLVRASCSEQPFPIPSSVQRYFNNPYAFEYVTAIRAFLGDARRVLVIGDRKSTRLNSSHVSISYAVFCLKKKK